jgi:hypothetical protein
VVAGVVPRLKAGGLLAGVAAGVVLPVLNKDGFGVACVACAPDVPDAAPVPKRVLPVAAAGC